jgi:hypothetical protein
VRVGVNPLGEERMLDNFNAKNTKERARLPKKKVHVPLQITMFYLSSPLHFASIDFVLSESVGSVVVWCGVVWCGVVWCGVVWCDVVLCGVVWCGVVQCGVVWCGVVWCGMRHFTSA